MNFDEESYLFANPDVVKGLSRKEFKNGRDHFEKAGINEQRFQKISLDKDLPLAVVHIPKCAGTSLRLEIDRICPTMYNGTKYSIREKRGPFQFRQLKKAKIEIESTSWTVSELADSLNQYDCVMGHISLRDFWKAGFRNFVVIVREPRIRLLSELRFLFSQKEYEQHLKDHQVFDTKSYFSSYAGKIHNNVISTLISQEVIFNWKNENVNTSFYWNDEFPKLMLEVFGEISMRIRSNESQSSMFEIDYRIMDRVHELTVKDSESLDRLVRSGLLSLRSKEKMDEEFQQYLGKNFKYVRRLL
jgi:hypothetical protein